MLRAKVAAYVRQLRNDMPRVVVDPNQPKAYEIWSDNLEGVATRRLIIYLRSSGCRWAIRVRDGESVPLAGCFDCEHSLAESTFGAPVSVGQYIKQFESAINSKDFTQYPVLCVYNEGNFFNPHELPHDARYSILRTVSDIPEIRSVIVESLPEYLNASVLTEIRSLLGDRRVEIGIGLESANPLVRRLCVNKSYDLDDFVDAVSLVRSYAKSLAYVLLKPSFLSEKEALDDALAACEFAFTSGVDVVSIEPLNISNYNLAGQLNRVGRYRPCWLWTVVEVAQRAYEMGAVRLGGEQFAPRYAHYPRNCPKCTPLFYERFNQFNETLDIKLLTNLKCECRSEWERELQMKHPPLLDRIEGSLLDLEAERVPLRFA